MILPAISIWFRRSSQRERELGEQVQKVTIQRDYYDKWRLEGEDIHCKEKIAAGAEGQVWLGTLKNKRGWPHDAKVPGAGRWVPIYSIGSYGHFLWVYRWPSSEPSPEWRRHQFLMRGR